jgi:hypothetical protein
MPANRANGGVGLGSEGRDRQAGVPARFGRRSPRYASTATEPHRFLAMMTHRLTRQAHKRREPQRHYPIPQTNFGRRRSLGPDSDLDCHLNATPGLPESVRRGQPRPFGHGWELIGCCSAIFVSRSIHALRDHRRYQRES